VSKKAFIKTVEAILAVLMLTGLYYQVLERSSGIVEEFERNPGFTVIQLLDVMNSLGILKPALSAYDLRALNARIDLLLSASIGFRTSLEYTSIISINNTGSNKTNVTLYFDYNFPYYVDTNSIQIFEGKKIKAMNIKWNWYMLPLTIENGISTISNSAVTTSVEISTSTEPINATSFALYIEDEKTNISISNFLYTDENNKTASLDLTFLVSLLKPYEKKNAYLYYAEGFTPYMDISNTAGYIKRSVDITAGREKKNKRADVYVWVNKINKGEKKKFNLKYGIGTSKTASYDSNLKGPNNNTWLTIKYSENIPKFGTQPSYRSTSKDIFTIKRVFALNNSNVEINLDLWYKL